MIKQKFIWVTFQKEGIHEYPDAPSGVAFLRYPHRHIFHFKVELEVFHDDREVEFILFKRELENLYVKEALTLLHKSCEMMSEELALTIQTKYPHRDLIVTISEDGENGSTSYYPKVI
jgi:hypothetical protein